MIRCSLVTPPAIYAIVMLAGLLLTPECVLGAGLHLPAARPVRRPWRRLMDEVKAAYPDSKWIQWEPVNRDNVRAGSMLAFGQYVETRYNLEKADVILSLDGDFLSSGFPGFLYYARQFAGRRNPDLKEKMSRFYSIQSTPTNTSGKADHRLPVRASEVETLARAIAAGVGAGGGSSANLKPDQQKWVAALVKDLQAHKGAAVVIPGDNQPPVVHALAHAMNQALGASGNTVIFTDTVQVKPQDRRRRTERTGRRDEQQARSTCCSSWAAIRSTTRPSTSTSPTRWTRLRLRVQHGLYNNETSDHVHWHVAAPIIWSSGAMCGRSMERFR